MQVIDQQGDRVPRAADTEADVVEPAVVPQGNSAAENDESLRSPVVGEGIFAP